MSNNGKFIISLDFELLWGMRDKKTIADYGEDILGVWEVIPKLLELFDEYDVSATFATVGFLFASTKEDLLRYSPEVKPMYLDPNLSPYNGHFDLVKQTETEDKYHFASELIEMIRKFPAHEIATHTYSHYYCNAEGQTIEDFRSDIKAAIDIAKDSDIALKSLVFPRNMFNAEYIKVCEENGITSYRGNELSWCYKAEDKVPRIKEAGKRAMRLLDAYANVTGHHCYSIAEITKNRPYNIPSSRFLRPYSERLKMFEGFKQKRILNSMSYAAKNNLLYHLWWHPHNFGRNQGANLTFLKNILIHYKKLNKKYNFNSISMQGLADQLNE